MSSPSNPSIPPMVLDGGVAIDVEDTIDCSFEFSSCVLRSLVEVDHCIDAFATCDGVIAGLGDAGPAAVCSLQFSACVLDNPTRPAPCIDSYEACLENPPSDADPDAAPDASAPF